MTRAWFLPSLTALTLALALPMAAPAQTAAPGDADAAGEATFAERIVARLLFQEQALAILERTETATAAGPEIVKGIVDTVGRGDVFQQALRDFEEPPVWLHGLDAAGTAWHQELPIAPGPFAQRACAEGLAGCAGGEIVTPLSDPGTLLWLVGWDGLILHSADGGFTWVRQDSGTARHLEAVDFVDARTGMAVGEAGTVLRTLDGGQTWVPVPGTRGFDHRALDCIDAERCWLTGLYQGTWHTADGGRTWEPVTLGGREMFGAAILMLDEATGLIGGPGLWRTADGGATWEAVAGASGFFRDPDDLVRGFGSADGRTVWAVGRLNAALGILKSEDAGLTWRDQTGNIRYPDALRTSRPDLAPHHAASDVAVSREGEVHVAALNGYILRSTDGGAAWDAMLALNNPDYSLYALVLQDRETGWAAGNLGTVFGTGDGGDTWLPMRGTLAVWLEQVALEVARTPAILGRGDLGWLLSAGLREEAVDVIARLRIDFRHDRSLRDAEAELRFEIALAAAGEGRTGDALAQYALCAGLGGELADDAHNNAAMLLAREGDLEAALSEIGLALAIAPGDALFLANRGLVRRLGGDLEGALADSDAALEGVDALPAESQAWVHGQRALLLHEMGRPEEMIPEALAALSRARPETLREVQAGLRALGLYDGPADGALSDALLAGFGACLAEPDCREAAIEGLARVMAP